MSSTDRIAEVFVDPELGREGFTYRLSSGDEGSVHIDAGQADAVRGRNA